MSKLYSVSVSGTDQSAQERRWLRPVIWGCSRQRALLAEQVSPALDAANHVLNEAAFLGGPRLPQVNATSLRALASVVGGWRGARLGCDQRLTRDSALLLLRDRYGRRRSRVHSTAQDEVVGPKEIERLLISEALLRAQDNQAIAAQLLGISRQALNRRLNKDRS